PPARPPSSTADATTCADALATSDSANPSSCSMAAIERPIPDEPPVTRAALSMAHPCKSEGPTPSVQNLGTGGTERLLLSPEARGNRLVPPCISPRLPGIEEVAGS